MADGGRIHTEEWKGLLSNNETVNSMIAEDPHANHFENNSESYHGEQPCLQETEREMNEEDDNLCILLSRTKSSL